MDGKIITLCLIIYNKKRLRITSKSKNHSNKFLRRPRELCGAHFVALLATLRSRSGQLDLPPLIVPLVKLESTE